MASLIPSHAPLMWSSKILVQDLGFGVQGLGCKDFPKMFQFSVAALQKKGEVVKKESPLITSSNLGSCGVGPSRIEQLFE